MSALNSGIADNHTYFELFGLTPQFNLDLAKLETNYRSIQSASHPDRFVTASPAEKLRSMQLATLANEAYQTLKNPANRAQYLLALHGIDAVAETNTVMPADFLMQQMEWREAIDDAKQAHNIDALDALLMEMQLEARVLQADLTDLIDEKNNLALATDATRKLIFIDKVCVDIRKIIEQLDFLIAN
ncbi:MAG: Fe-S protein assembly co-chaperone HscB [Methylotenera sp.]|nr:MAG: Fe-S protein assembly co-chaperone HscB [Methylotenera sp.]